MFCKECGAEIPDGAKHCSECGAKVDSVPVAQSETPVEKESFFKKNKKVLIGCCIGLVVIFLLVAILSNGSDSNNSNTLIKDSNLSEEDFKAQCEQIDFNTLNKNPDNFKGDKLQYSGKIIQIMEDKNGGVIRLATDGSYSDVIYVVYEGTNSYVEDDYITVYGYCDGSYTYTSTIGASITLPKIDAIYIDGA